jgi:hypothetical protein
MLLDAVFNADYEFDICFVKKLDFGIENWVLNFSKIRFWDRKLGFKLFKN